MSAETERFDLDEYVRGLEDEDEDTGKIGNVAPDWGKFNDISALWSEILPGLWVGGTHDSDTVGVARDVKFTFNGGMVVRDDAEIGPDEFDAVVTLYAWARPVDWHVEEYRWAIMDGGHEVEAEQVKELVVWAHKRWKAGKKVLIRCQAGLSRSTFITTLVLVRDGWTVDDAIDRIREKRSRYALTVNGSSASGPFTRVLRETPVEFWRK